MKKYKWTSSRKFLFPVWQSWVQIVHSPYASVTEFLIQIKALAIDLWNFFHIKKKLMWTLWIMRLFSMFIIECWIYQSIHLEELCSNLKNDTSAQNICRICLLEFSSEVTAHFIESSHWWLIFILWAKVFFL